MPLRTILCSLLITLPLAAAAQAQPNVPSDLPAVVITGPQEVAVGRTIVLEASASRNLGDSIQYRWFRGESNVPISRSVEAVFTPEKTGVVVIRLEIDTKIGGKKVTLDSSRAITVFERKIVLIADSSVDPEKLQTHLKTASDAGVYLRILQPETSSIPLSTEDALQNIINEESATLNGAEAVVLWADGIKGLQALMRSVESAEQKFSAVHNQTLILITDGSIGTLARTARGPFSVIRPERILVTRKEAINPLINAKNFDAFVTDLERRDIDSVIVDASSLQIRPWNLLSVLVSYMLTHGVSSQTVILLLMLPVIATILAFLRQVVGISTFGLYTPSIIALSFLALGWGIGLLFLLFILITGYATRAFMRRWRLLHVPKVAIILTVVSLTVLVLLGIGAYEGITLSGDTIFVLLIMSTLAETFLTVKAEEGLRGAIIGVSETVIAALICVFLVQLSFLQSLILAYPETILLTIVINIAMGRWTGLRIVEYFRFREVFRHLQEE